MSKEKLDNYELFYLEIPQPDYLDNIDDRIQDHHDEAATSTGLSNDQVSKIADDQLRAIKAEHRQNQTDNGLFSMDRRTAL